MTAASKTAPLLKLHCRGHAMCETRFTRCEAVVSREETGECTGRTSRGMGPSTCTRSSEITSGRTISQRGLATTCKDRSTRGTGVGGRVLVWRMSQYEQRRRGNALRGGIRCHPSRGNASRGQRGSRRLVDIIAALGEGLRAHKSGGRCDVERWSKPVAQGVYVGQRLSFGDAGKARLQTVAKVANRTREIRPSGMKTGARGNVTHGGTRNPIRNRKSGLGHSPPTGARASVLSKQSPCPDLERARGGRLPRATRHFLGDGWSAGPTPSAQPCPMVAKPLALPGDDRARLQKDEDVLPARPCS